VIVDRLAETLLAPEGAKQFRLLARESLNGVASADGFVVMRRGTKKQRNLRKPRFREGRCLLFGTERRGIFKKSPGWTNMESSLRHKDSGPRDDHALSV